MALRRAPSPTVLMPALLAGLVFLAPAAGFAEPIEVHYLIQKQGFKKETRADSVLTFDLYEDPACATLIHSEDLFAGDSFITYQKFKPQRVKGADKPPQGVLLFAVLDPPALTGVPYVVMTGAGIVPEGDSCQVQLGVGGGGPAGPAGVDGLDGATGPAGPAGADGADGATGPAGADGADGATGPAGADGADGATGPAGADGADGATGPAGADGADGATGPAGADGADGATGPAGADGADGATGPAGADGADGATGPAGADGADGATGPAGADGADGATGPAGADGADGATGPAGADGADGATGPAGADGADGATGPAGADGADGATGPTGPAGANGADGATGPTGPAGADGADGATGPTGPSGTASISVEAEATVAADWPTHGATPQTVALGAGTDRVCFLVEVLIHEPDQLGESAQCDVNLGGGNWSLTAQLAVGPNVSVNCTARCISW
jgi:hypothetical protein